MVKALLGKKVGMTQVFDEENQQVPVTVLSVGPCYVTQVKDPERDNSSAVQIGYDTVSRKNVSKPMLGHFDRAGVEPQQVLADVETDEDAEPELGQELGVEEFEEEEKVDVTGVSKGRGFTGSVKRHGFSGGPKTHGSEFHRTHGSVGPGTDPGRVHPGTRMAGHYGAEKVTERNLEVVSVDTEKGVILVKGSVPGAEGSYVTVRKKK
jgi:large subunit ribosomal protein L3